VSDPQPTPNHGGGNALLQGVNVHLLVRYRTADARRMSRSVGTLLGIYLLLALSTRAAERMGATTCDCSSNCWCKESVLSTFRSANPYEALVFAFTLV